MISARSGIDIIDASSITSSVPGPMSRIPSAPRRPGRCPRNTALFSAARTPASASTFRAACAVAMPSTCPIPASAHACAAAARTAVFPLPAGPVITSTTRADVSACHSAAPWSSRSPDPVTPAPDSRARSYSCASSSAASAPSSEAACSRPRHGAPWR